MGECLGGKSVLSSKYCYCFFGSHLNLRFTIHAFRLLNISPRNPPLGRYDFVSHLPCNQFFSFPFHPWFNVFQPRAYLLSTFPVSLPPPCHSVLRTVVLILHMRLFFFPNHLRSLNLQVSFLRPLYILTISLSASSSAFNPLCLSCISSFHALWFILFL